MKHFITSLMALAAIAMPMSATDYTDVLTVKVDGQSADPSQSTISIDENSDGTYKLALKNFIMAYEGEEMPVGTIVIDNVSASTSGTAKVLQTIQDIVIAAGDDDSKQWMGPMLSADGSTIPVSMVGVLEGDKFRTVIDITFSGMTIKVGFGTDKFQIPNSDFESFHTASYGSATSDEPNNWHSFMSCTGTWASYVSGTPHTFISNDVRPGTTGTKSVKVSSGIVTTKVLFVTVSTPANGTLTTGRLQAGSSTASNTANCAFLDMSKTDKDANGDPFYAELCGKPDAINLWVKFKQGTLSSENAGYKYATVSSTITDGTYYQDPEDDDYTNIVAKAKNAEIESKDAAWQELNIPFDYDSYAANGVSQKAILVTMSTNAQPGVGSTDANNPDELYVDDLSLVYNSKLASLSVKGTAVEGFDKDTKEYNVSVEGKATADDITAEADGQGAYVTKTIENVDGGQKAVITVIANDLSATNTYTLNITNTSTGIDNIKANATKSAKATYNLNGQRVSDSTPKGLLIVRQADGKAVKVIKK